MTRRPGPLAIRLGVLDQTPVPDGSTAADAVGETLALARAVERLGYHRYWLSEHHDTPSLAGTAPEVLVAAVAAATATIRVGSGGVLLPYYSPLKVAEVFRMLNALFPGRIDLGIGRAAGTGPAAEAALLASGGASGDKYFANHLADLMTFLGGGFPADDDHPYAGVRAMPDGSGAPSVWLLGSSGQSSAAAAAFGLAFAFAHFIKPEFGPQIVDGYRRRFRSQEGGRAVSEALVAVAVVCAETDAEAQRQASATDLWRLGPEGSRRRPILSPEQIDVYPWTEPDRARAAEGRARMVVGAPDRVRARLVALAEDYGTDELMIVTVCHDPRARLRSYELLAEVFDLPGRSG
ncbi:MAG: MsnO8 family LLM class oxidoreductase [Actinomycetota bacterium]|nr:MsnO8 family LLM class oxidoreductase [Actinomycetota bacterium]